MGSGSGRRRWEEEEAGGLGRPTEEEAGGRRRWEAEEEAGVGLGRPAEEEEARAIWAA